VTLSDSGGFIHDEAGIDREKLKWVMELKNVRAAASASTRQVQGREYHGRSGTRPQPAVERQGRLRLPERHPERDQLKDDARTS
jgi:hypothetical protein